MSLSEMADYELRVGPLWRIKSLEFRVMSLTDVADSEFRVEISCFSIEKKL